MNDKASVSKDLNARHAKILEGLLKLPENKECADCRSRAPRWASVNLGIFICMQCSGAHRSLGVHISKVRSATLDTWLPEQIAFMQSMGNEKSNSYWESELPRNFDRSGSEKFIRSKYEEKRWVPKNSSKAPQKTRKFSLDEDSIVRSTTTTVRPRPSSLDLNEKGRTAHSNKGDGVTNLFTLLYAQDPPPVSPSRWVSFE